MKVGDKLIYKLNKDLPNNYIFETIDNAFYFKKSYEIIKINLYECHFIDELGNVEFFFLRSGITYYIWDYFYTQKEHRQLKLNSL